MDEETRNMTHSTTYEVLLISSTEELTMLMLVTLLWWQMNFGDILKILETKNSFNYILSQIFEKF